MLLLAAVLLWYRLVKYWLSLEGANPDQTAGIKIVARAIEAPLRQIAENAGVDGAVVAGKVRESADLAFGFNAQTEEYGDLFAFGVIDPAKVVRTALEDAASVAGLLITTEAMVADQPEKARRGWRRHARYGWHGRHGRHDVNQPVIYDLFFEKARACRGPFW